MACLEKIGFAVKFLRCVSVVGKRSHYSRYICRHMCSKNKNFPESETSLNEYACSADPTATGNDNVHDLEESGEDYHLPVDTDFKEVDSNDVKPPPKHQWTSIFKRYKNAKFPVNTENDQSFATMLRKSKFVQMGELSNVQVIGEIFEVVDDDLYIDFGGKFHCVCQRPSLHPEKYIRGAQVNLMLKSFEMSRPFLGSDKHVTLLEADAILLSLVKMEPVSIDPRIVPTFEEEELVTHYGLDVDDVVNIEK